MEPVLNRLRTYSEFIIDYLYKGCLNWSYFFNNGLDDTKAPTAPASAALAPTKTSKKRLKKSSLKGSKAIKRKATKATKPIEEDAIAIF